MKLTVDVVSALTMAMATATMVLVDQVHGHGYMMEPKARNYYASAMEAGVWWCNGSAACNSVPAVEDTPQGMNGNNGGTSLCGVKQGDSSRDYDHPKNYNGGDLQWMSQAMYNAGQEITIDIVLTAHHMGHFEMYACGDSVVTKECFENNPLEFVSDNLYGAVKDVNYPQRAYIPPTSVNAQYVNGGMFYSYQMKLPQGVSGRQVLLQWRYYTANSCYHVGYDSYPFPSSWSSNGFASMYSQLGSCGYPLPEEAVGAPERFWNCAEISIDGDSVPTPTSPITPAPVDPAPAPVNPPTPAPVAPVAPPANPPTPAPVAPVPPPTDAPVDDHGIGEVCCSGVSSGLQAANDCSGFVHCVNGAVVGGFIQCPANLLFQASGSYCDWPQNVSCESSCDTTRRRNKFLRS